MSDSDVNGEIELDNPNKAILEDDEEYLEENE